MPREVDSMKKLMIFALATGVGITYGCQRQQETRKVETETTTETTRNGETVESETKAAGRVPGGGEIDTKHQEFVGVVTDYTPGKSLKIKAADGETHSFDLNERGSMVKVESGVKVGAKVAVMVHQEKDQPESITVATHS
jgi:hypothetical protein